MERREKEGPVAKDANDERRVIDITLVYLEVQGEPHYGKAVESKRKG